MMGCSCVSGHGVGEELEQALANGQQGTYLSLVAKVPAVAVHIAYKY
jgi:hypothetical protein